MPKFEDVGKRFYCEYEKLGLKECPATKRKSCVGCKAHRRIFKSTKKVRIRVYRQHNNHYWIEEEDLAKLVPDLEPDDSKEVEVTISIRRNKNDLS